MWRSEANVELQQDTLGINTVIAFNNDSPKKKKKKMSDAISN